MENGNDRGNVIQFRRNGPIFNSALRAKLEEGVSPHTEKPTETIKTVEQVLCSHVVQFIRDVAIRFATRLGGRVGEAVQKIR